MLYIQIKNLFFAYSNSPDNLFENLNIDIYSNSRIGLIGKNGTGKSTLFKLILKYLKPDKGIINIKDNLNIGFLGQEIINSNITVENFIWESNTKLSFLKNKIQEYESIKNYNSSELINIISEFDNLGGYIFDSEIEKVLEKFSFRKNVLKQKINELSGGEKNKLLLASLLLKKTDILLLDEPTNHIDIYYIEWLEDYLLKLKIPYIIISHDRKFLDKTTNKICLLENCNIQEYTGNYSFYSAFRENEIKSKINESQVISKKIKKLEISLIKRKNKAKKFENFKPTRSIKKNGGICKRDEGSGSGSLSISKMMKSAVVLENRINKIIEDEKNNRPFIEKNRDIFLISGNNRNKNILEVRDLEKSFQNNIIFQNISFLVSKGEKIHISGKNGSGKTTLIKTILGFFDDYKGYYKWADGLKIGYYSQEHENIDHNKTIIDEVITDKKLYNKAMIILGSLNLKNDKLIQKISSLSSGEKTKVSISKILLSDFDIIILDEPLNHLEISARENLEKALINFEGTIIFISHDRYFSERLRTRIINL